MKNQAEKFRPIQSGVGHARPTRPKYSFNGTAGTGSAYPSSQGTEKPKRFVSLRERIELYLDACPAAISGQGGHTQTFLVAIALVRGFNLSQQAALPVLESYNDRCEPRWSRKELLHKLKEADLRPDRTPKPRGYLL